jgi:hypothetical protein
VRLRDIRRKIERTTDARTQAWRSNDPTEAARCTAKLDELYAELRVARARSDNGDPTVIAKRARVERELEKLSG